jgi:hypothetical protein
MPTQLANSRVPETIVWQNTDNCRRMAPLRQSNGDVGLGAPNMSDQRPRLEKQFTVRRSKSKQNLAVAGNACRLCVVISHHPVVPE